MAIQDHLVILSIVERRLVRFSCTLFFVVVVVVVYKPIVEIIILDDVDKLFFPSNETIIIEAHFQSTSGHKQNVSRENQRNTRLAN